MTPQALLDWYDGNRRDLPWRTSPPDPYRVWVSEIMLQQTRVETVVAYFRRFLERFPTVRALADAPLDDVLALWSGLGYYARARNLHRAARAVRDLHGGTFPSDPDAVRALPGIGDYTAGAILSIAFGRREAVVDGNVIRVLARLRALEGNPKESRLKNACWEIARALVPAARPGDFNQALMELGATVCTPLSPRCGACPVARGCEARALGRVESFPAKPPKAKRPHRRVECAIVDRAGRVVLVRRPDEGLLGGLWELPSAPKSGKRGAAIAEALSSVGLTARGAAARVCSVDHAFTHFDLTLDAFVCEATGDLADGAPARWVAREELSTYGMGAATKRVLDAFSGAASRRPASARSRRPPRRGGREASPRSRPASARVRGRGSRRRSAARRRSARGSA